MHDKWHLDWKDIIWLALLVAGFVMHWAAFQTRLGAVESVINGSGQTPPIEQRVSKLEQAFLDMHDLLKDIKEAVK